MSKVINPLTGRKIMVGGATYKKVFKQHGGAGGLVISTLSANLPTICTVAGSCVAASMDTIKIPDWVNATKLKNILWKKKLTRKQKAIKSNRKAAKKQVKQNKKPTLKIGNLIGTGAHGNVYEISNNDTLVAKIFHKKAKDKYILERNNMLIVNNFPKNIPVIKMIQYIDKARLIIYERGTPIHYIMKHGRMKAVRSGTKEKNCRVYNDKKESFNNVKKAIEHLHNKLFVAHGDLHDGNLMIFNNKYYINDWTLMKIGPMSKYVDPDIRKAWVKFTEFVGKQNIHFMGGSKAAVDNLLKRSYGKRRSLKKTPMMPRGLTRQEIKDWDKPDPFKIIKKNGETIYKLNITKKNEQRLIDFGINMNLFNKAFTLYRGFMLAKKSGLSKFNSYLELIKDC